MKNPACIFVLVGVCFLAVATGVLADDATVLPKGVFNVSIDAKFYLPIDKRYGPDGNKEDLAEDLNGVLDSSVFPGLALFEIQNGGPLPEGSANIGETEVDFELHVQEYDFYFTYGLTPKLTIGTKIPFISARNDVDTDLDTSNATIGKNPLGPGGFAPIGTPGTTPLTRSDVQQLIVDEYGFDKVNNWSKDDFGDIEIGARYQYFNNEWWRLAFTGGVRMPTGDEDDPDDLADYAFGTGAWALLANFNQDFLGFKDYGLELNATFKYEYYFEDNPKKRVPEDVNQPVVPIENKENVDRKIGDVIKLDLEGRYEIVPGLSASLFYRYLKNFRDQISGDGDLAYSQLQKETNEMEQQYRIGLTYSTIPLYAEKKFPVPMTAKIYYRNRFDGENVTKSNYIGAILSIYF
jgi:hypothetical protein